jgi:bifunctional DNA-binding transcriptional regulator/antitoxin component of YhaV-PrlF toxin-antitoxin module
MSGLVSVQRVLGGKRISIPEEASRTLGLDVGDFVIVEVKGKVMHIKAAKVTPR